MLADEDDAVLVIDGDDAGGEVREMHDAVDPGPAVRPGDLVVPDGDPRVLVGDAPRVADESALHRRIVARRGRAPWARRRRPPRLAA